MLRVYLLIHLLSVNPLIVHVYGAADSAPKDAVEILCAEPKSPNDAALKQSTVEGECSSLRGFVCMYAYLYVKSPKKIFGNYVKEESTDKLKQIEDTWETTISEYDCKIDEYWDQLKVIKDQSAVFYRKEGTLTSVKMLIIVELQTI